MNFKVFLAAAVAVAVALPMSAAQAATWVSKLEYRDISGVKTKAADGLEYGTVTLVESLDGKSVDVTVSLRLPNSLFINSGSKEPFTFNTVGNDAVSVAGDPHDFYDGGRGTWTNTPWGEFTNRINCCQEPGHGPNSGVWSDANGATAGRHGDLKFTVTNASGLTFAGLNPTVDTDGRLLALDTSPTAGDHFYSNGGGWWFAADIYDGATGGTYAVAAADAFGPIPTGGVPEPGAWALMILGFGGVGATIRLRRTAIA